MKKILLAFDGTHFSEGAFTFANEMNKIQPVMATGVFLPVVDYSELLYSLGGISGPSYLQDLKDTDSGTLDKNIKRFMSLCSENGLQCKVHSDFTHHIVAQLKKESRFADLLVIGGELFYENLGEDTQDEYLENTLQKSECPVIIVPEKYQSPTNIIFAYDGSPSSVYAIKQFAYLFPEFKNLNCLLVYANPNGNSIPDYDYLEELGKMHFSKLDIMKLSVEPKKYFETWILEHSNAMLVTGSYSRSAFSEMLKKSFIKDILHDHKIPIFVAHR